MNVTVASVRSTNNRLGLVASAPTIAARNASMATESISPSTSTTTFMPNSSIRISRRYCTETPGFRAPTAVADCLTNFHCAPSRRGVQSRSRVRGPGFLFCSIRPHISMEHLTFMTSTFDKAFFVQPSPLQNSARQSGRRTDYQVEPAEQLASGGCEDVYAVRSEYADVG